MNHSTFEDDNGWCCCDMCGRDTKNKSRICAECMRGVRRHKEPTSESQLQPHEIDDRDDIQVALDSEFEHMLGCDE